MKIPWSANAPKSFPPAAVVTAFSGSPLILIVTSPEETNLDLANKITITNASTIAVNIDTPRIIISIDFSFNFLYGF